MRVLFGALFVLVLDYTIDLGTSPALLCAATALGVWSASRAAAGRLRHLGFALLMLLLYSIYFLIFEISAPLLMHFSSRVFAPHDLAQHAVLVLAAFVLAALSTWCFWRFKHALSLEILFISGFSVFLFSGHRNYRFDLVKVVNNLAWRYNLNPLAVLVLLGIAVFLALLAYLYLATPVSKPDLTQRRRAQTLHYAPANVFGALVLGVLAMLFLSFISIETYQRHMAAAAVLVQNGVGDSRKEGLSPLTFQSALGSSNQPSALVRLESDLRQNPFSPMLYLRESALSQFNGRELVAAGAGYDRDVSNTKPSQPYSSDSDTALDFRTPATQSVYLLTEHNLAFGIDYPIYITALKLPTTSSRFKGAYRVYSMAPAFALEEIKNLPVGDPRWSEQDLGHYLATNPDPRYAELAKQITENISSPVGKAFAVAAYLSKTATYTLTPHHQTNPEQDPVAPFLFGDNRGYCVHFAHAIAFMLRSLGIPSRIATGYLTDLSQAKDGHILLRMSDRHAWAEVYITGRGWVPFDVKPEKVESHAETPVDMGLLEELMGLLGPGEEIIPKDATDDEAHVRESDGFPLPGSRDFAALLLAAVVVLVMIKIFLLHGWLLPAAPALRLRRAYRGWLARLYDLGIRRERGETRVEFQTRLQRRFGVDLSAATSALNAVNYCASEGASLSTVEFRELAARSRRALGALPWFRRIGGLLNPASVLAGIGGWKW